VLGVCCGLSLASSPPSAPPSPSPFPPHGQLLAAVVGGAVVIAVVVVVVVVVVRDLHGFGNPCGLRVWVTIWVPMTRAQPATMPDVQHL
jgi:hypothetical protein